MCAGGVGCGGGEGVLYGGYGGYDAMGRMKSCKRFVDVDLEKHPLV